ncbi:antibiotic biosynthesis monooxygenase [Modestobacter altitudinis]|uniref:antibiotic biosynthesis monooxygenase n=1 Tax=Modestobacter altitudinis TaxID=2213158 RepID=UPI00110CE9C1|nr:antibiotic biosynthesis monooxygenase [Modestobacter altitudinis]
MYARTATLRGNPGALDEATRFVREEWLPTTTGMDGCTGMSMLAGPNSGRCIVTTGWETEAALKASEQAMRPNRAQLGKLLGAVPLVAQWEIAVMHRAQQAGDHACCRVTWSALRDPAAVDEDIATFRMTLLPRIEELPGFSSVSLMVDRLTGRAVAAVNYVDRNAMIAAGQRADQLQGEYSRSMGGRITEVAELDLVIARLRIPETV